MAQRAPKCARSQPQDDDKKKYVLVLYTGGTIGMIIGPDGKLSPACPGEFAYTLKGYPDFSEPCYAVTDADKDVFQNAFKNQKDKCWRDKDILSLQKTAKDQCRIIYGVLEFSPLLDSSNMKEKDWKVIADAVSSNYTTFSGFVILHGTDTMAYTSSALSFMFENLGKAVIVTGSQVPLVQLRTDAIENFLGALILAGQYGDKIPEVGLFFESTLFRGNRVTKVNASGFGAYDSPNYLPLAKIGVDIEVYSDRILPKPKPGSKFQVFDSLDAKVGVLTLFPGITTDQVKAFFGRVDGAVIMTFGAGNCPDDVKLIINNAASTKLLVNITQCLKGKVEDDYDTALQKIVSGKDMTFEAALTKICYLLKKDTTLKQQQKDLGQNMRGEMITKITKIQ